MAETANKTILNRELSWMDFNGRCLEETMDRENPILERFRFLAITASNLDEFFMVRVAGVKGQVQGGVTKPDVSGRTPEQLYAELTAKTHDFMDQQEHCLHKMLFPAMKKENIQILKPEDWNERTLKQTSTYFEKVLFPVLTPMAVDKSRPFPMLANKSLNLALHLKEKEKKKDLYALVQVPAILPRFFEITGLSGRNFVMLEDIIAQNVGTLFTAYDVISVAPFRITRDSDLDIDEDGEDFLAEVKKSIKKRKTGKPIRLEILKKCDQDIMGFLIKNLKVKKEEIYQLEGPLDLTCLSKFAKAVDCPQWSFEPVVPVNPPADFFGEEDIFAAIRKKDRFVHHPYESFDTVVNFIKMAAVDPDVLAIKQTLYRVSGNSPIVAALSRAAENGKQVTVLVELKARFDEENNLQWADKLEHAGCHVIYGLSGLKTHCKIALVVRREEDGIRRYVHLGTGNYNDSTARIYTDCGLFTCKEPYGADASALFNVLTGYSTPPEYLRFHAAPLGLRSFFEERILQETAAAQAGKPSGIVAKVNSLVDPEIINLLYDASNAGVKIKLIVRGICCLLPGVPGMSENIEVHSVVGQLLEHSRIFRFENEGDPELFMGSADWMQRNLDRRVELVFPLEEDVVDRAQEILDVLWEDTENTRIMQPDGNYIHQTRRGKKPLNCQREFSKRANSSVENRKKVLAELPLKPIQKEHK